MALLSKKIDSPSCMCHFKNETIIHYFLDCFLYTVERQSMFDQVSQLVTNFDRLSKTKKIDILLFGLADNEQFDTNIKDQVLSPILKRPLFSKKIT